MKTRLTTLLWLGVTLMVLTNCGGGDGNNDEGANLSVTNRGVYFDYPSATAVEVDGQLVVVDANLGAVLRVDPASGNRTVVSDASTGSAPILLEPVDIEVEADGKFVVVDASLGAVLRVDPVSGNRTVVSDASTGSGPILLQPVDIAVEADGHLVVADLVLPAVIRIDPETGVRAVVTGCPEAPVSLARPRTCPSSVVGNGPLFEVISYIKYVAVEPDGNLLISGWDLAILRVDPVTGDRVIVTGCRGVDSNPDGSPECLGLIGDGPLAPTIGPMAVDADGQIVAADWWSIMVFRIDPVTGNRTIVSGCCEGGGTPFPWGYEDLAVEADGNLILTGYDDHQHTENGIEVDYPMIVRIDPMTGFRNLISGGDFGPAISQSFDAPPVEDSPPPVEDTPPVEDSPWTEDEAGGGESGFKSHPLDLGPFVR